MNISKAFDLSGRVALVTGASRGIGRAMALGLGECGAAVAVHYFGRLDAAAAVAGQIPHSCVVQANLAEAEAPEHILHEVRSKLGEPDILIANASVQHRRPWDQVDRAAFDEQIAVNLRSTLELIQLCAPAMVRRGWGRILTIGSVQQYRPHPQMLAYAATKSALENLARNFAKQLAPYGVTVNNLSPGVILTDRNIEPLSEEQYAQKMRDAIPARRFGTPEDCVAAMLLLCSDAGGYITGIDLPVDGGLRLP